MILYMLVEKDKNAIKIYKVILEITLISIVTKFQSFLELNQIDY